MHDSRKFLNFEGKITKKMKKKQKNRPKNLHRGGDFQPLDRRYDSQPIHSLTPGLLETITYEYPGKHVVVNIETDEFTAVCPWSGLPDFGIVKVDYVPQRLLLELRSVKYYLFSYRNVGIYQEHAVNRIMKDLVHACAPKWMKVTLDYNIRGGVHTVTSVEHGRK